MTADEQNPTNPRDAFGADQLNAYYTWGRVGWNDDGSLDEIVVNEGGAHLEQTSAGSWVLAIDRPDLTVTVWLSTPHTEDGQATPITARWEIGPGTAGATNVPQAADGTTNEAADAVARIRAWAARMPTGNWTAGGLGGYRVAQNDVRDLLPPGGGT